MIRGLLGGGEEGSFPVGKLSNGVFGDLRRMIWNEKCNHWSENERKDYNPLYLSENKVM